VAAQVTAKRPDITIRSLQDWRGGELLKAEDAASLSAAAEEGLVLVTYDQSTIVPLLTQWAAVGRDHAGVVFVDERSIAQSDGGGKVRALTELWQRANGLDWTNVVAYLKR
jgi:hypothetical protein